MSIAICIATYKRPELLRELLIGLSRLIFFKEPAPQIQIIVVDNDPLRSAEPVCAAVPLPWPIKYFLEERRGITHVRTCQGRFERARHLESDGRHDDAVGSSLAGDLHRDAQAL